jgi:hypothetical protein
MKKRSYHDYFTVPVWSRDCEVPDHRIFDVDYRISKACGLCEIYKEMASIGLVKDVLYPIWMDLPMEVSFGDY